MQNIDGWDGGWFSNTNAPDRIFSADGKTMGWLTTEEGVPCNHPYPYGRSFCRLPEGHDGQHVPFDAELVESLGGIWISRIEHAPGR